jgi:hypothetical protein
MNIQGLKKRVRMFLQWVPFTWNTLFFSVLFWLGYRLLHQPLSKANASNEQLPFVRLMASFIGWFVLGLLLLSVLSVLLTWLYFLWLNAKGKSGLEVHFYTEEKRGKKRQFLDAKVLSAIRPLLGVVKARLLYDEGQLTDKFGLLSARLKKGTLLRDAIVGKSRIELPDIKEYTIKAGMIFFEDFLQLVSLPVQQKVSGTFYQAPDRMPETVAEVSPRQTNTMDIRIEQLRKVEGDLLHYKTFESGDDVRRIVWKVFAKNRNLVVRIPEQMEPYASHLNFYASFYNCLSQDAFGADYFAEMLNLYKINVWSVYKALQEQEWQIKYIPDQEFHLAEERSETERNERVVSNSVWQNNLSTGSYFSPKKGTVLVISSLIDPKELATLLDECDTSVQIIYVPLSHLFRQYVAWHWLKALFFVAPPDRLSRLRSRWLFSPLRRQMLKREKEIERLLGQV